MELSIQTTAGDYGTKLAGWEVNDNTKAMRYIDFALLQAYNQIQSIYGYTDAQMVTLFGADFMTTGNSDLTNSQRAQALSELIRMYLLDLARAGREKMLDNQAAANVTDTVYESDFGDVS